MAPTQPTPSQAPPRHTTTTIRQFLPFFSSTQLFLPVVWPTHYVRESKYCCLWCPFHFKTPRQTAGLCHTTGLDISVDFQASKAVFRGAGHLLLCTVSSSTITPTHTMLCALKTTKIEIQLWSNFTAPFSIRPTWLRWEWLGTILADPLPLPIPRGHSSHAHTGWGRRLPGFPYSHSGLARTHKLVADTKLAHRPR